MFTANEPILTHVASAMPYGGNHASATLERTNLRNRHGRGTRTPMFGTRLPRYRTRTGMFDDMVAAQVRRLGQAWPELIRPLQFAVEDVRLRIRRLADRAEYDVPVLPASHGIPARVVLYRMPLQTEAPTSSNCNWPSGMSWWPA